MKLEDKNFAERLNILRAGVLVPMMASFPLREWLSVWLVRHLISGLS